MCGWLQTSSSRSPHRRSKSIPARWAPVSQRSLSKTRTTPIPAADDIAPVDRVSVHSKWNGAASPSATWLVDRWRFWGQETQLTQVVSLELGSGLGAKEFVLSINPKVASGKTVAARSFASANGVGMVQLMHGDNCGGQPPVGKLPFCISVDQRPLHCVEHDFTSDPVLQVPGEWSFGNLAENTLATSTTVITVEVRSFAEVPSFPHLAPLSNSEPGQATPATHATPTTAAAPATLHRTKDSRLRRNPDKPHQPRQQQVPIVLLNQVLEPSIVGQRPQHQEVPDATSAFWAGGGGRCASRPLAAGPDSNYLLFTFTLRRADGVDLGLEVDRCNNDQGLRVEAVRPSLAIDAWNRQCASPISSHPEKSVLPGDEILSVNGKVGSQTMLEECRQKLLLKLVIARARNDLPPAPPCWADYSAAVGGYEPWPA